MGTHPIFESDFDCLTECSNQGVLVTGRCNMGRASTCKLVLLGTTWDRIAVNSFNRHLSKLNIKQTDQSKQLKLNRTCMHGVLNEVKSQSTRIHPMENHLR